MRITEIIDDGTYNVLSNSGQTYRVCYSGAGDGNPEYLATWSCNCPARSTITCKHITAVSLVSEYLADQFTPDEIENETGHQIVLKS